MTRFIRFIVARPAPERHLLLLITAAVLGWGAQEVVPVLEASGSVAGLLIGGLLTAVLAVVTPFVTSYGVGAAQAREMGARNAFDPSR